MVRPLGRPRKIAVLEQTSALVPAELMVRALRQVAETPIEEMTIARFIDHAAEELAAVFAQDRSKSEIVRKTLPILAGLGWHGQESDILVMLDAFEAKQAAKNIPPPFLLSVATAKTTTARGSGSEISVRADTPRIGAKVGPVPQPHSVDDDGYEAFGVAESEAGLHATVAEAAQPTESRKSAEALTAAPNPGNGTGDQDSEAGALLADLKAATAAKTTTGASGSSTREVATASLGRPSTTAGLTAFAGHLPSGTTSAAGAPKAADAPLAKDTEQARIAVPGIIPVTSRTLSVTPDNGPPRERTSSPRGDERDRPPMTRGTATSTDPARSTSGMLDLRPSDRVPDPNRAGVPVSRPTQSLTLPIGQNARPTDGDNVQGDDAGSRSRP